MSRIVILGGGESGTGAAVLAKKQGFDVFLSDKGKLGKDYAEMLRKWDIPFEEGGHSEELILNADEVIKSPGIPNSAPLIQKLTSQGTHIISEIEFAGRYDRARRICITGSNGKTTTTSLIYHLLSQAGLNVGLGGNIGKSYAYQVATSDHDIYVLEISSFQLDNMYDFKADIAIITNITPDHLDRYNHDMEEYVKAKFRITRNMSSEDCFIFCSDDEITINHLNKIVVKAKQLPFTQKTEVAQGAFVKDDKIVIRYQDSECDMYIRELALGGRHNVYNSMAAAIAAKVMDIDNGTIREALSSFQPVEHRLEKVASVGGVLYVNDSKATNVDAAWYALECQKQPVVWIVGGTDKGNDYSSLVPLAREKVRAMVCMGVDNHKFHESFDGVVPEIVEAGSAHEAVQLASRLAKKGDVVLLSPCCASFDLFRNYEDRGEQFKAEVRKL
ncbi:MAG: UDP-N-acetylmuramoyl-L-alanine--D-glutamate ligase [Bacteroidales bacterium]|nr:UDP-N-acetylmuramoyl-L-alanine--D-glutamate ligase [Bacteroidales bacterium]MDY4563742.1 UDP-N-acetylmuramoyl-L-alanine--D-glutamate ligase [Candidatus Cryptobacteroides sp.]MDY6170134.1 UDP-N-acetylmuramoyl-L-alanine--D-glutamate ligase [Candidatus Cryptobacteroides sp.]